jgi:hypothetical protein
MSSKQEVASLFLGQPYNDGEVIESMKKANEFFVPFRGLPRKSET